MNNLSSIATLPTQLTAEYWATRIGKAHAESVAAIIRTGANLLEAKAALAHGEWGRLTGQTTGKPMLPFARRTAQCLMQIAEHAVLSNGHRGAHLPASWRTLATLSALPAPIVEQYIADDVIHPELDRKTAEQLVTEWRESAQRIQAPLIEHAPPINSAPAPDAPDFAAAARPLTTEEQASLDGQMQQALHALAETERITAQAREAYRSSPADQGAWDLVVARIGSIADLSIDLQQWLEERLQPLPTPDAQCASCLCERLANAQTQLSSLRANIYTNYFQQEASHANH